MTEESKEILLYFIFVYLFSWVFWIPAFFLFSDNESVLESASSPLFIALQTIGAAGPSIVAWFFTRHFHGKSAVQNIVDRYKILKLEKKWYFISVLLVLFISLFSLLLHIFFQESPLVDGHPLYETYKSVGWFVLLLLPLFFVVQIFSSPLLEEFGWRGYAQPLLQKNFNILASSTIVGTLWGFWHLPLMLVYSQSIPVSVVSAICHSIIIGWIMNSTQGSMLMVLLFHASLNVGLNIVSPGHDDWIMIALTIMVTGFIVYKMKKDNLEPFNKNSIFTS